MASTRCSWLGQSKPKVEEEHDCLHSWAAEAPAGNLASDEAAFRGEKGRRTTSFFLSALAFALLTWFLNMLAAAQVSEVSWHSLCSQSFTVRNGASVSHTRQVSVAANWPAGKGTWRPISLVSGTILQPEEQAAASTLRALPEPVLPVLLFLLYYWSPIINQS